MKCTICGSKKVKYILKSKVNVFRKIKNNFKKMKSFLKNVYICENCIKDLEIQEIQEKIKEKL